ncbi:hypothetical protein Tco_0286156 [Tanacetum coccineum]
MDQSGGVAQGCRGSTSTKTGRRCAHTSIWLFGLVVTSTCQAFPIARLIDPSIVLDGLAIRFVSYCGRLEALERQSLKAISTLLMALPNEHQLKFNSYMDAKTLIQSIENRFRVNPQEGFNQKFLRSLSQEWTMHTIMWRNKQEIETLSLNDFFNNLKAYESEVKGTSSSTTNSHNVDFMSSSNTNNATKAVNTAQGVNTASTKGVADSSTTVEICEIRDGLEVEHCYADYEGKKILEEYWKEARHGQQRKNRCRAPMNQDSRNKEPTRRTVPVEETTSNSLVSHSSSSTNSEVSNDLNYCSSCLECVKDRREQNEQLVKDLRTARISAVSYKTGLESVDARLLVFKKNESVYEEDIKLLKCEIYLRNLDIIKLKRKLELATKEKDEVQLTVQKFENLSKSLSKLLDSQIMDKYKTRLGYNAVPPLYTGNFMPPKPDLVFPSLDDFVDESVSESVVEKPTVETNEPKSARKENRAPIIKDWVSESKKEDVPKVKTIKILNKPSFAR